jgi:hypothetical protein
MRVLAWILSIVFVSLKQRFGHHMFPSSGKKGGKFPIQVNPLDVGLAYIW